MKLHHNLPLDLVIATASASWLVISLKSGKTFSFSRATINFIVDRRADRWAYWFTLAFVAVAFGLAAWDVIDALISN